MTVNDNRQHDRSFSASASSSAPAAAVTVCSFRRQPTAFAGWIRPNILLTYCTKTKTKTPPIHAAMPVTVSADGTSIPVLCVEGYSTRTRTSSAPPGAVVVDSIRACLQMDRINHSSDLGLGQSPARVRVRAIILRPTPRQRPPPPLLLYMSLLRLLSRPRRSPPFPPDLHLLYTYTCSCLDLCSHIKET
jgi:hypothetical protein